MNNFTFFKHTPPPPTHNTFFIGVFLRPANEIFGLIKDQPDSSLVFGLRCTALSCLPPDSLIPGPTTSQTTMSTDVTRAPPSWVQPPPSSAYPSPVHPPSSSSTRHSPSQVCLFPAPLLPGFSLQPEFNPPPKSNPPPEFNPSERALRWFRVLKSCSGPPTPPLPPTRRPPSPRPPPFPGKI